METDLGCTCTGICPVDAMDLACQMLYGMVVMTSPSMAQSHAEVAQSAFSGLFQVQSVVAVTSDTKDL